MSNCDLTSAYCVNTVGSYDCECSDGYIGDGETCNDIDECLTDTVECADDAFCKNIEGSYICQCRDGFTGNGRNCLGLGSSRSDKNSSANEHSRLTHRKLTSTTHDLIKMNVPF